MLIAAIRAPLLAEAGSDGGGAGGGGGASSGAGGGAGASGSSGASGGAPSGAGGGAGGAEAGGQGGNAPPLPAGMKLPPSLRKDEDKPKAAAEPGAGKYKLKRGGKEAEHTIEELLALASDDYEHELSVDGKPAKMRLPDLYRNAALGQTSHTRMRQAAAERQQLQEMLAYARNNVPWFLESQLGVENHTDWAAQIIEKQLKREAELNELLQRDPHAYHERVRKEAAEQNEAKGAFDKWQSEARSKSEAAAHADRELRRGLSGALAEAGLPRSKTIGTMALAVHAEYAAVGYNLSPEDVAALTRERYVEMVHGWLDGMPDDRLLEFLGTERRKKLRELELRQLNGGKDEGQRREREAEPKPRTNGEKREEGLSPRQFLRSFDKR